MRFEKLEIVGFKSFADRTVIQFQPGMTAIVGPNGCGKSNIADSIRWVLGEQNARHIRGEKMDDIIFAGTAKRKPTGLAEVSLTISGVRGMVSSEFGEYDELTITRRLYRSGESDYLINKIHCRLKDIRDIFLDTGIGARTFSIMEQGKIDAVLTREPQDRRFIVEEVAGITKFKARRAEALSRLESTEQNLIRIRDIIAEVKRQSGSLDRQAKKAERYHTLNQEAKEAELVIARHQYAELLSQWLGQEAEAGARRTEESGRQAQLGAAENRIEETKLALAEAERRTAEARQALHGVEREIQQTETTIALAKNRISTAMEQRERAQAEARRLNTDTENTSLLMVQQETEGAQAGEALATEQTTMLQKNTSLMKKSQELRQREAALDEDKGELFRLVQQMSEAKSRIASAEAKEQNLEHREERRETELRETLREMESNEEALSKKTEAETAVRAGLEKIRQEQGQVGAEMQKTQEAIKECRHNLTACRDNITRMTSRLHSLEELERNLEGFNDGVKAALHPAKKMEGVHCVVAQILTPRGQGYEVAIEAALGDRLQHVVVKDQDCGRDAAMRLKTGNSGRATFIPLSSRPGTQHLAPLADERVIGPAVDLVECKDGYRDVVESLLGDVVVVRDLEAAMELWGSSCHTLVTMDGEILHASGAVTGGGAEKLRGGILTKKREIRDLGEAIQKAQKEQNTQSDREKDLMKKNSDLSARREELVKALHAAQIEEVHCQKDISAIKAEIARLLRKRELLQFERDEARKERDELGRRLAETREAISALSNRKATLETAVSEQQEGLMWLRDEVEEMREEVNRLTVAVTTLSGKKDAAMKAVERFRASLAEMAERRSVLTKEVDEATGRREAAERECNEADARLRELLLGHEKAGRTLAAEREVNETHAASLRELEEGLRTSRKGVESIREALRTAEMKSAELRLRMDHLKEGIQNRFEIDLAEDSAPAASDVSVEEVKARLESLRKKIDELGPVNLAAVEEYRELKERHEFLTRQEADLVESVQSLRTAIGKINKTSETLFIEAFNAIDARFREMFTVLFEGGAGRLVLTDPENLLETGVDIVVQPPGKKLQHISLMSGGEKAMSAIALLFACFLVKPSPFCLMDEVDAALDDTNVRRFSAALKQMTVESQFAVVTHNKGTMEMADALYGVTMEEAGVSRLISVALTGPTTIAA